MMTNANAARCPRCNAPESRHNDDCPLIVADLKQIAANPRNTDLYRAWARKQLRAIAKSQAVAR